MGLGNATDGESKHEAARRPQTSHGYFLSGIIWGLLLNFLNFLTDFFCVAQDR